MVVWGVWDVPEVIVFGEGKIGLRWEQRSHIAIVLGCFHVEIMDGYCWCCGDCGNIGKHN
ncbi:hypothetical protein [Calothrix sp. NIES-3974]|uniref:hypothetical protein n=1 Tax=Calothrix sp. NIES-3974 TaxID=2005462 RepID=UPI001560DBBB|nr:hypothetical protein [Calothrix sp. NIES-3974]